MTANVFIKVLLFVVIMTGAAALAFSQQTTQFSFQTANIIESLQAKAATQPTIDKTPDSNHVRTIGKFALQPSLAEAIKPEYATEEKTKTAATTDDESPNHRSSAFYIKPSIQMMVMSNKFLGGGSGVSLGYGGGLTIGYRWPLTAWGASPSAGMMNLEFTGIWMNLNR